MNIKQIGHFILLWSVWTLLGAALLYVVASSESDSNFVSILSLVLSLSPLLGLIFWLGSQKVAASLLIKNELYETSNIESEHFIDSSNTCCSTN